MAKRLDRCCPDGHQFMLVEFPSDHDDLNRRVFYQGQGHRRAVGNHRDAQIRGQVLGHLQGRGAPIQNNNLLLMDEPDGGLGDGGPGSWGLPLPLNKTDRSL